VSEAAGARLERLILTHSLPSDTRDRVKRSLRIVEQFPHAGRELAGEWAGFRFVLGPWRWLVIVYSYDQNEDVVHVVTVQDARSSQAVTTSP
jgi:mRNA-degrading endonuclease RelE of RelBE toxin-antitoxin system